MNYAGKRQSVRYCIYLMALGRFYVELYFFRQSGEYATLSAFEDLGRLSPYLRAMDIYRLLGS